MLFTLRGLTVNKPVTLASTRTVMDKGITGAATGVAVPVVHVLENLLIFWGPLSRTGLGVDSVKTSVFPKQSRSVVFSLYMVVVVLRKWGFETYRLAFLTMLRD